MKLSDFPDLGVGVGLRSDHYPEFLNGRPPRSVSWVEVITENYLPWEDGIYNRAYEKLEIVRRDLPVALHGVSMSIGSTDPLNENYLKRLKELCAKIQPAWVSDHLCWTGVGGESFHDLLPLPYTEESLHWVVKRIQRVQEQLGRRILIENVSSYVDYESSEMSEWDFVAEVARQADCGLLLDVNNIYVSGINHGFDPRRYLDAIPIERVGQIHLAGHTNKGNYLIDTHDEPICEEVWSLYQYSVRRLGGVSAMVERDDNIPVWSEMERELGRIQQIRDERGVTSETRRASAQL